MPLFPAALRSGDRVAVVSPSGPLRDKGAFDAGLARLRRWGLKPEVGQHAMENFGFLAGQDAARASDLAAAISDPGVRGIFCTRGGYGLTRILPRVDFAPLASDPRPIVGFSDVTALLCAAWNAIGLVSFHGPMVGGDNLGGPTEELQRALLFEAAPDKRLMPPDAQGGPAHTMVAGCGEGPLVGGNLSLLAALHGTPYAPKTACAIVFLEDTDEAPYRVDRMLTQLLQSGFFDRAVGVVLGEFSGAAAPSGTEATDLMWVLHDRLGRLRIPVTYGFPFGHRPRSWTLPFGARARIDAPDRARTPKLVLLEPAVRRLR